MQSTENTYQPRWEERKARKHHHHHHSESGRSRRLFSGLSGRDKQAYIGLILVLVVAFSIGGYMLVKLFVDEFKQMPNDNPATEMNVDALGIRIGEEYEAILAGDSLARELKMDSLQHSVVRAKPNVYRPHRPNDSPFLNDRDWKSIKKNYQIWLKEHGTDWEVIIGLTLLSIGLLSLIGYGIYKHKHRNE